MKKFILFISVIISVILASDRYVPSLLSEYEAKSSDETKRIDSYVNLQPLLQGFVPLLTNPLRPANFGRLNRVHVAHESDTAFPMQSCQLFPRVPPGADMKSLLDGNLGQDEESDEDFDEEMDNSDSNGQLSENDESETFSTPPRSFGFSNSTTNSQTSSISSRINTHDRELMGQQRVRRHVDDIDFLESAHRGRSGGDLSDFSRRIQQAHQQRPQDD